MTYIPKGRYLTVEQYQSKLGIKTKNVIIKAIHEGRLKGAIFLDKHTPIIPEDAILISKALKTGKYIGVSAWLRGEIEHQDEVANWNRHQEQLRRMRENDLK